MRVLHLSTSSIGGAGVVAARIAELQMEQGHEVTLITLNGSGYLRSSVKKRAFHKKLIANLNTTISLFDTDGDWRQLTPISASAGILPEVERINPDVIHIHNWFNLLSLIEIQNIMKTFPCVFHLHDERMLTGGCHFTLDCDNYKSHCNNCPATSFKKSLVRKSKNTLDEIFSFGIPYGLVFPSNWLAKKFVNSSIQNGASSILVSTNPIDESTISSLRIPKKQMISCGISDLNAKVKGFDNFLQAVELLRANGNQISIIVVGGNPTSEQISLSKSLNVDLLGRMSNAETLKVIGSSNLLVVPSHSENSPTVILEAQSLGTCVLATNIPGCRELIEHEVTGYLCEPTPKSIFKGIEDAFSEGLNAQIAIAARASSHMRSEGYLLKLTKMYQNLIQLHGEK